MSFMAISDLCSSLFNYRHSKTFFHFLMLILFSFAGAYAAETKHPAMYKGIGNTYQEESQTIFISAATLVQGTNIRFVSRNPADLTFSGNNVQGFIQYEDPLNNTVTIFAIASRPVKNGSDVQAVYLYVADSLNNNSPTGEAYLLVFPGFSAAFPGTGEIGSSSDPVDNVLNDLLPALQGGSIGNNQTLCGGATPAAFVSLSAGSSINGAVTYQWESSTNNTVFSPISGAVAATYQSGPLTVTTYFRRVTIDPGGNTANSNVLTVTVNTPPATPTISAGGATTFCSGGSVVLTATAGASSYAWYRDAVLISTATAQTFTASTSGAYTVIVTNGSGCSSAASAAVNVTVNTPPATPTISAGGATTFCSGGSVVLTATAGASSYAWYRDAVLISTATAQTFTASTSGAYTVIVTNSSGCSSAASAAVNVTVNTPPATPTISAGGATTFCSGGSVVLTATAGASSYTWYRDAVLISTATAQTFTASTSGAYTVIVTNGSGCSSAASAAVNVTVNTPPATPTISAGGATTFCSGGSVVLTATAGASSYAWYRDAVLISTATAQTFTASTSGAYTVIVTNSSGCSSAASAAVNVTVNTPPAAPGTITGITETFPTRTNVYSVNPVAGATSYIWTLSSGWTGNSTTNSIQVKAGNSNGIISVVAVANGCSSTAATLTVKVGLFIADVMTPNGDGFNDAWLIMRPASFRIGITIYNRWGQVVFRDTDYQNTFKGMGTGSFLGKELPSGTYYYLADITDTANGSKQVQKGYLTLKREK